MLRDRVTESIKAAMRDKDRERTSTLRLIQAAVQDRDIANRGSGKDAAGEDEILQVLTKMVKQREDSAAQFDNGNRPELAAKERAEIAVIGEFLPRQLDQAASEKAIDEAIESTGAQSIKDMGRVMAALKERYTGQMDFGKASGLIKAKLGN